MTINAHYSVPAFAIIGHPNEGKSTIVSTLAEDDSVCVSPVPGETRECMEFPVMVDGKEIIRFIDTPGFQNPRKTLEWIHNHDDAHSGTLKAFISEKQSDADFADECKLLTPVSQGAGIIYIVDGSRPLRKTDIIEMEILRLTGQPRIAIINSKDDDTVFIQEWKTEFLKHFNSVRLFNGHTATYLERIELLESLKAIFQDWEIALSQVISAFRDDWAHRNRTVAEIITDVIIHSISYKMSAKTADDTKIKTLKQKQLSEYKKDITAFEKEACQHIRKLYKHNIFDYSLPPASLLHSDLFDEESVRLLGLKPNQIAIAGGVTGGLAGAAADIAAHGLTFGIFTTIGGAAGAGYAYIKREKMVRTRVGGFNIGKRKITTGPCKNIQFMYVILDRLLLYYAHVINWAHGRREGRLMQTGGDKNNKQGFVSDIPDKTRKTFDRLFSSITGKGEPNEQEVITELEKLLNLISNSRGHNPFQQ